MEAKVIAIINRKGGCGKTTTAKNLAYDLSNLNKRVLLIDMDPQRNCTDGLSIRKYKKTVISLLQGNIKKCIYTTRFKNLDLIPGSDYLASEKVDDQIVKNQLQQVKKEYDYIIIDTSPYFNKLIAEIMLAHDFIIIPTEVLEDSVKGMVTTISELQHLGGNDINFKILFTKIDRLSRRSMKNLLELQNQLNLVSLKSVIYYQHGTIDRARKRRIPLSKAYKSRVTKDYQSLANEVNSLFENTEESNHE